jgi:hypothetical protein
MAVASVEEAELEIMVVNDIPGIGAETYERVLEAARVETDPPEGLIIHASGGIDVGWRVLSVWRSGDAFERFRDERLIPAVRDLGLPLRPTFERSSVHRIIQPS